MNLIIVGLIVELVCTAYSSAQTIEDELSNSCTGAKNCSQCIRTAAFCSWCGAEVYPRGVPRCDIATNVRRDCPKKAISHPKSTQDVKKNADWTSGDDNSPPIQVKPQVIEFNIKPNDPMKFKVKFKQQANYPLDLYFLLDISYGMFRQEEAQQRLIALGKEMPEKLKQITNNYKLGFGTFVDKVVMPYTAWTDQLLKARCPKRGGCSYPHSYKNQVELGAKPEFFTSRMTAAMKDISQSMDDTEGGLEALVQALDCDQIGWRKVSRRIIVYSSNSYFHLAGSGKLGGATKQSDLKCSLNDDGEYIKDKIYDYPSVSQIAHKLKEKKANIIFAVMKNVSHAYHQLESFMPGAVVGELEDNSNNIVQLISDKYYDLRSRIEFQTNNDDFVKIQFKSKCLGNVTRTTNRCKDLNTGEKVEFDVTMTVDPDICRERTGIVSKNVSIDAVGLNEQVTVMLKVTCGCDCESTVMEEPKCTFGNGTMECGICNCDEGRYGRVCECDESEITSEEALQECRKDINNTLTCQGNGECICGQCECYAIDAAVPTIRYSGEYCECNDFSCPRDKNGLLCGGSTHGVCQCGKCSCLPEWSRADCSCTTSKTACIAANNITCNGVGECECGVCRCTKESGMVGLTCEDCTTCPSHCSEYKDCAQCTAFGTGKYNQKECDEKCKDSKVVDILPSGDEIRPCSDKDVDGCRFYFTYTYTKTNYVSIRVQTTKKCPEDAPLAAIVGGTVAAVVLIPLLIICLIIFIRNRQDAKEFAAFMKDREKATWDAGANPIYKGPESTFQNPTFNEEATD